MKVKVILILIIFISTNILGENKDINSSKCEHKLIKIIYGLPSKEGFKLAEEEKIILGGCIIRKDSPKYYCLKCKKRF